jgi:cobyrinic acid a,c-diamide synthase
LIAPGLVLAAPSSGSGKTTLALGLARHLRNAGVKIACAKSGPDYIDPSFHAAASGQACVNLDRWAMREATLAFLMGDLARAEFVLCEGAMGLYDGVGAAGAGSTAELAAFAGWPVVLVVDSRGLGASAGPLIAGFARARGAPPIAGVVFNRVGAASHAALLREALALHAPEIACLGAVPRDAALAHPERHLGLVQARERADLDAFLDRAADIVARHVDIAALRAAARASSRHANAASPLPPLGQRIAIARDDAFAFVYAHVLDGWRRAGAELSFFAPLDGQTPDPSCDAVYLPGGYPELHAGALAAAPFLAALRDRTVFGECGGYMVLGESLIDAGGTRHAMAGLLPLETSFAARKLHLGYRQATLIADHALGKRGARFKAHEFHYSAVLREGPGDPLFEVNDARGVSLGAAGARAGKIAGSFIHLIDQTLEGL